MTTEQLVRYIREYGPMTVADIVSGANVALQLTHGWDFTAWSAKSVPGAIFFFRVDSDKIAIPDTRVLAVNAPEAERPTWERVAAQSDAEVVVLMMPEPGQYQPLQMNAARAS